MNFNTSALDNLYGTAYDGGYSPPVKKAEIYDFRAVRVEEIGDVWSVIYSDERNFNYEIEVVTGDNGIEEIIDICEKNGIVKSNIQSAIKSIATKRLY